MTSHSGWFAPVASIKRPTTTTNGTRYAASGTAHKSGAGAIVVVTCAVTATSCADGTAVSTTQRALRAHAILDVLCAELGTATSLIANAHARTSAASTTNPPRSTRDCMPRSTFGSITSGYAASAASDPTFDAT